MSYRYAGVRHSVGGQGASVVAELGQHYQLHEDLMLGGDRIRSLMAHEYRRDQIRFWK